MLLGMGLVVFVGWVVDVIIVCFGGVDFCV